MANRQHGKSRSPAGGRTVRPVPASRPPADSLGYPEPEVRRWPHPVEGGTRAAPPEPALHYIRCAMSYQNQLLADIKALLEQLAAKETPEKTTD
ncbi:MAG: hypothetical protein HFG04_03715 [Oscillibacter sp.]|jgi:hypothetical protein|nr:hypothetical protein [Oscillibacter sp.]MCI9002305.1 hypothetical protein [Oscillibacter sp.]